VHSSFLRLIFPSYHDTDKAPLNLFNPLTPLEAWVSTPSPPHETLNKVARDEKGLSSHETTPLPHIFIATLFGFLCFGGSS
jgi:hypothetical protein